MSSADSERRGIDCGEIEPHSRGESPRGTSSGTGDGESAGLLEAPEAELEETRRRLLSWRKLLLQAAGFAVGSALLAWILVQSGPGLIGRVQGADPWLLAALLGTSVASLALNGAIFWLALRPLRRLPMLEVQCVNALAGLLNYAPVRLGVVARIAWHLRVDRLRVREVAAWFASVTCTILVPLGAAIVAALLVSTLDWRFALVMGSLVVAGGAAAPMVARARVIRSRTKGLERVLTDQVVLWGSLALRIVDLGFWALRMLVALRILGLELTPAQGVMLAMANLAVTLNPLGRVGFREATTAFIASRLLAGDGDLLKEAGELALVESAGEFLVAAPAGLIAAIVMARRWREASRTRSRGRAA